ncbi:MAG TPA: KOW motif-containing protein [Pirellulales bacterium]|nr:KOW motif-containing protein [Pirellulales bacterium]
MSRASDDISVGQRIRIIDGIFVGFEAIVESVDQATGEIGAGIHIFGKVTPVQLKRDEIEPKA